MSEWKEYIIENLIRDKIISVGDGYRAKNIELGTAGIPFARAGNIDNGFDFKKADFFPIENLHKVGNKKSEAGDIVFTSKGTVGRFAFVTEEAQEFVYSPQLCYWRSHNQSTLNSRFLYYWMHSREFLDQVHSVKGQTDMADYVSLTDQRKMKISIPAIDDQLAISSALSSLDDKIDLLHRQNKTLEAMAETLFRQWFVEEAEESWEVGKLEDEFDFVMGQSPNGSDLNESQEGVIFYQGRSDFGFRFPEPRIYTTAPKRFAQKFDTLVSVRAPVGDMNMAIEECCLGRGVAAFRYKKNPKYYSYTYYKMRSLMELIKQFEDNGSIFGSIGKDDFKKIENVIPSSEWIEKFQRNIESLDKKIYNNSNQITSLIQLRDSLLPKLISGELAL